MTPVRPILSALLRRKSGALLVAAQVALTLAVLCNAVFVATDRLGQARQPSGTDEAALFHVAMITPGADVAPFDRQRADEALVRAVPGVRGVAWINQMPLAQSGNNSSLATQRGATDTVSAAVYAGAHDAAAVLGLRIVEGRGFTAADEVDIDRRQSRQWPAHAVATRALAERLFPDGASAVGRVVYAGTGPDDPAITIVGVVERLVTPWGPVSWNPGDPQGQNGLLLPWRQESEGLLAVRADPAQIDAVRAAVAERLRSAVPGRIVRDTPTMTETRERRYRSDTWLARLMTVVIGLLLVMTAGGIVGLASLWVTQRRKQIGVRRALGARRVDIVMHFVVENLMITGLGVAVGLTLAVALNQALTRVTTLAPLPGTLLAGSGAAMLVLGVAAVLAPALRAARVPPAEATRSV